MHLPLTCNSSNLAKDGKASKKIPDTGKENAAWKQTWGRACPEGVVNFQEFNLHVCLQNYSKVGFQGYSFQIIYTIRKLETRQTPSTGTGYINHGLCT